MLMKLLDHGKEFRFPEGGESSSDLGINLVLKKLSVILLE